MQSNLTPAQLAHLQRETAARLRATAWRMLISVVIICGNALVLASGVFSDIVTFADKLVWGALALAVPGTALAAYFFYKARQMASGKL